MAETRCRSSLVDFSQSISRVSSAMICSHSELLEVVDFDAALMKTLEGRICKSQFVFGCRIISSSGGCRQNVVWLTDKPTKSEVFAQRHKSELSCDTPTEKDLGGSEWSLRAASLTLIHCKVSLLRVIKIKAYN